jgi:hypothetical protein
MKNALIAGVIGLLFMAGGFAVGLKMMPKPKAPPAPPAPVATTMTPPGAAVPVPTPDAISMDTLKKTSESMMALNLALAEREKHVAEREAKAQQREDELDAERAALDSSHEKFKALFQDFQARLQLVEANQLQQLQKQAEFYNDLGPEQSIELIRTMDDNTMTRLFSVMETKSLAKLVTIWRAKYPDESDRLVRALNNTAQVIDKDKMVLNDPLTTAPAAPAQETSAPAPAADSSAPAPAAPAPSPAPAPAPDANAPDNAAPAVPPLAPPPEPKSPANPRPVTADAATSADDQAAPVASEEAPPLVATLPSLSNPGETAASAQADAPAPVIDPNTIPVAPPASPADLDSVARHPAAHRAQPLNVQTAASN